LQHPVQNLKPIPDGSADVGSTEMDDAGSRKMVLACTERCPLAQVTLAPP
jgi:hypothetical protein